MLKKIASKFANRFVSRWLILAADIIFVLFLFMVAYVIRFNFNLTFVQNSFYWIQIIYIITVFGFAFTVSQSYVGVIRHTTITDIKRIVIGLFIAAFITGCTTLYVQKTKSYPPLNIPFSVIIIHFLLNAFVLVNSRLLIKAIYISTFSAKKGNIRVLIIGAGELGMITKDTLNSSRKVNYNVIGFVDDNPSKQGKNIEGIKVYSSLSAFNKDFLDKEDIQAVIFAVQNITLKRKQELINQCLELELEVKIVPPVEKWMMGEFDEKQIHHIKIEDLLGRDVINLDNERVRNEIAGKNVLITGAAGSIGSEIVRQVIFYKPAKLIVIDQAETPIHDLRLEVQKLNCQCEVEYIIADVNNRGRLQQIFERTKPNIVFHAAAYKHVPLMEENPYEAIKVNIGGTKNMADLSVDNGVERFVMISTDKAVNPTNVMGATKRVAEKYVRSVNKTQPSKTQFVITRFGNVLGSNGSVIPLFKKQIDTGGPITVTHPEITRYFMTIPEACQLVLEAGFMGKEGEIFVFDMGEPVKIFDLAKKMIMLSGLTLGIDVNIEFTGLRPGEKLYEELLAQKEITKTTHNPKILIGKVQEYNYEELMTTVSELILNAEASTDEILVGKLKQIVPEFKSNNSIFCNLDR